MSGTMIIRLSTATRTVLVSPGLVLEASRLSARARLEKGLRRARNVWEGPVEGGEGR